MTNKEDLLAALDRLGRELRPFFDARHAAFETFIRTIEADGFVVEEWTDYVPIQITGRLPEGARFYFRSRWDTARLDVWRAWSPAKDNLADERFARPDWSTEHSDPTWDMFAAGWLEADETEAVLHDLVARWRNRR